MSAQAKTVLWVGLFMILFGIVANWPIIRSALYTGGSSAAQTITQKGPGYNVKVNKNLIKTAGHGYHG